MPLTIVLVFNRIIYISLSKAISLQVSILHRIYISLHRASSSHLHGIYIGCVAFAVKAHHFLRRIIIQHRIWTRTSIISIYIISISHSINDRIALQYTQHRRTQYTHHIPAHRKHKSNSCILPPCGRPKTRPHHALFRASDFLCSPIDIDIMPPRAPEKNHYVIVLVYAYIMHHL